ncbi:MAG: M23 family metallopeptidase, partial [Mycobacteriales bacterium]
MRHPFAAVLAALVASAVALPAPALASPALALVAVDTTGTTYDTAPVRIAMTFPVAGPTSYSDTWLSCRSGCGRKHMGQDLMGAKMTPMVAAFDGVVSSLKRETTVGAGNYLVITGDNGWSAIYLHVNNDTPGT